jgi:hypothetical protein
LSASLSVYLSNLSAFFSLCLSICPCLCFLCLCFCVNCLPASLPVYLSISLLSLAFICVSMHQLGCLSASLSFYLSFSLLSLRLRLGATACLLVYQSTCTSLYFLYVFVFAPAACLLVSQYICSQTDNFALCLELFSLYNKPPTVWIKGGETFCSSTCLFYGPSDLCVLITRGGQRDLVNIQCQENQQQSPRPSTAFVMLMSTWFFGWRWWRGGGGWLRHK